MTCRPRRGRHGARRSVSRWRGRARTRARARAEADRKNLSKTSGRSSVGIPGPLSCTSSRPPPVTIRIGVPSGLNLTALPTRLSTARSSDPLCPAMRPPEVASVVMSRPVRRPVRAAASAARSARSIVVDGSSVAPGSPASSTNSRTNSLSSRSSALTSARMRPCSDLSSDSARCSNSMFVRMLVKGVRSSCPASATSCCCCRRDVCSASSMALKLRARRPTSSSLATSIVPASSWVRATCSAALVSRSTGRSARRASSHAIAAAAAANITPSGIVRLRRSFNARSVSPRSRATCTAPFPPSAVVSILYRRPSRRTVWRTDSPPSLASRLSSAPTGSCTLLMAKTGRPSVLRIWTWASKSASAILPMNGRAPRSRCNARSAGRCTTSETARARRSRN